MLTEQIFHYAFINRTLAALQFRYYINMFGFQTLFDTDTKNKQIFIQIHFSFSHQKNAAFLATRFAHVLNLSDWRTRARDNVSRLDEWGVDLETVNCETNPELTTQPICRYVLPVYAKLLIFFQ